MDDLTARVIRLEQEARTWRIAALAVTTLALVGFGVTQVTAQGEAGKGTTVKAPFVVTDAEGDKIAEIRDERGTGVLTVHAAQPGPKSTVLLSADIQGSSLTLFGDARHPRAMLTTKDRDTSLTIWHKGERPDVDISADINGGELTLSNSMGKPLVKLPERR